MKQNKHLSADNWGTRLRSVLKEKSISIRKAASIAQVAPSVIDSWSSGASPKDFQAVKRLADQLNVSFSWLLTGERESGSASLAELFSETPYFDGYARIRIDQLTPKGKNRG